MLFDPNTPRGLRKPFSSGFQRSDQAEAQTTPVDPANIEALENFVRFIDGNLEALPVPKASAEYKVKISITCSSFAYRRERFYRQLFDEQPTQERKAYVASCYVFDAPPTEWPLAAWIFEAMDSWRALANMRREKYPSAPTMQEEEWLRSVSSAMVQRQIPQNEVVGIANAERSRQGVEGGEFDAELYRECYERVDQIKKIGRWLKENLKGPSQKEKREAYLVRMIVGGEKTSLNCPVAVPHPLADVVGRKVLLGQRKPSCFESKQAVNGWVLEIARGRKRPDHAAAQLYQLYDSNFSQKEVRSYAARIQKLD